MKRFVKIILCLSLIMMVLFGCVSAQISSLEELENQRFILDSEPVELKGDLGDHAVVYRIKYKSDEYEVVGYIAAPIEYKEKNYPVLIYNRGGNGDFGKLDPNMVGSLATANYIVLASQYRGVDGGTGFDEFGGEDIHDVLRLIDISEDFDFAQKGGVYMAGHSRGGMMAYIACRKDERIKAAAVISGVSDLTAAVGIRPDMASICAERLGGTVESAPKEYEERSALNWADEINAPILIIHGGEKDWRVPTQQSIDMDAALEKAGKEHKLIIYENADHSLNVTDYMYDVMDWFNNNPIK